VPSVQSSGVAAGSKFVRRVTAQERVGSSRAEMGLKRVSSKALDTKSVMVSKKGVRARKLTMSGRRFLCLPQAAERRMCLCSLAVAWIHSW
jgi:hypothetical protein